MNIFKTGGDLYEVDLGKLDYWMGSFDNTDDPYFKEINKEYIMTTCRSSVVSLLSGEHTYYDSWLQSAVNCVDSYGWDLSSVDSKEILYYFAVTARESWSYSRYEGYRDILIEEIKRRGLEDILRGTGYEYYGFF